MCTLIDEHLARLAEHIVAAAGAQVERPTRTALVEVEHGVAIHRATLART